MQFKISQQLGKDVAFVKEFGYQDEHEFIQDAVRRRMFDLKKSVFLQSARKVRKALLRAKLTEKDILQDFKKQSRKR